VNTTNATPSTASTWSLIWDVVFEILSVLALGMWNVLKLGGILIAGIVVLASIVAIGVCLVEFPVETGLAFTLLYGVFLVGFGGYPVLRHCPHESWERDNSRLALAWHYVHFLTKYLPWLKKHRSKSTYCCGCKNWSSRKEF
jgi:hypothetical protein